MAKSRFDDYRKNFVPSDPTMAPEQELFAKFPGPYSVLSAGAGSGKTYTIEKKVNWLTTEAGLELKNILALSFTRTAANNLSDRYPGLKSMTFDSFSADIFEAAFPKGAGLVIADDVAVRDAFRNISYHNGFNNLDPKAVEMILKTINQTTPKSRFQTIDIGLAIGSLTMAINRYPDAFKEMLVKAGVVSFNIRKAFTTANALSDLPDEYADVSYLIIDEAQDSTQPETVMALTLATHNDWRVAIVGDASQNISEWRGVTPDAFMESQNLGGFENFSLQSNYRSEFPILHTANQLLEIADTNAKAKIQLKMPKKVLPLTDEFQKSIQLYTAYGSPLDMKSLKEEQAFSKHYVNNQLPVQQIYDLIQAARVKKQSFAILARSNLVVNSLAKELNAMGADVFVKPTSERASTYRSDVTSRLLNQSKTMSQLLFNLTSVSAITNNLQLIMKKAYPSFVKDIQISLQTILNSRSVQNHINNHDLEKTILSVQYMMTRLEARENAKRQQLDNNDAVNQLAGKDYVVATYHASKGLEWDNVLIIDENRANASGRKKNQQEELRLAYVAITRARKTLKILQLLDPMLRDPMVYANTKPSILQNPFGHAYVLALNNTYDQQGHKADVTALLPGIDFIEHDTI